MLILAIDPGPEKSSWVCWQAGEERVVAGDDQRENADLAKHLKAQLRGLSVWAPDAERLVIERPVVLGGKAPTAALMETSRWAGVFEGAWPGEVDRLTYHRVRAHLTRCGSANEAAVREALISRFAPSGYGPQGKGTKANPGPFYGVAGHMWSAVAVAVAWWDLK